jgi:hypothetical protein
MKQVLNGENPSDVFKALLRDKPTLTTADLAQEFRKAFPSTGVDDIWNQLVADAAPHQVSCTGGD